MRPTPRTAGNRSAAESHPLHFPMKHHVHLLQPLCRTGPKPNVLEQSNAFVQLCLNRSQDCYAESFFSIFVTIPGKLIRFLKGKAP